MANRAVYGQSRPDTDAAYHKPHLVHQAVSQNPSQIVFDHRIKNRESRHNSPDPDEGLSAWEPPCKGVHRHLGGKGAQENGSGDGRLRVTVWSTTDEAEARRS